MERILVLCDDFWHPGEIIELGLRARKDTRFQFDVIRDAKDVLTPEYLRKYRAVVCCKSNQINGANQNVWFQEDVNEVMPRDLEDWVREGGGFLALHSGLAFKEDDNADYLSLVGSAFINHPHRCAVTFAVTDGAHPIAQGLSDFTVRDEHYNMKMLCEDAKIFLESRSETGGVRVAGYTREVGKGRVCALTPGHILGVWEDPMFQKLMTNALEWCLGER